MKKQKPDPLERPALMAAAVDLLSRRDYSRRELWRKLAPKAVSSEDLESVLDDLSQRNWQSDERVAAMFLRSRSGRGLGPRRLQQELQQKGISSELTSETLSESDQDWFENAREVAGRKARSIGLDHPELKNKLWRFMSYRGFSGDQITYAIEHIVTEGKS
ncbi:MAG: recombination regulator RecX [Thalassolituus sp.]